jgi:hypothetical protein
MRSSVIGGSMSSTLVCASFPILLLPPLARGPKLTRNLVKQPYGITVLSTIQRSSTMRDLVSGLATALWESASSRIWMGLV